MTLYLLPNSLGWVDDIDDIFPKSVYRAVHSIDGLIAENGQKGRGYLQLFKIPNAHDIPISVLNKESSKKDLEFLLRPILDGENWGLISDCGLPCVADPGANLVYLARKHGVKVEGLVGPSSIFLALMLSGLPSQQFFFHGYIPKLASERKRALTDWEKMKNVVHIFIEAPYRNKHTLQDCVTTLNKKTLLCVASNLTQKNQFVHTSTVEKWSDVVLEKDPTIFLFTTLK